MVLRSLFIFPKMAAIQCAWTFSSKVPRNATLPDWAGSSTLLTVKGQFVSEMARYVSSWT